MILVVHARVEKMTKMNELEKVILKWFEARNL